MNRRIPYNLSPHTAYFKSWVLFKRNFLNFNSSFLYSHVRRLVPTREVAKLAVDTVFAVSAGMAVNTTTKHTEARR